MTTKAPGESITPQITIKDADGQVYDPTSLTLKIYDSGGTLQETIDKGSMTNPSTGVYYYVYDLASDADEGDWRYDWIGGSADTVIETVYFTVETPVATTLATTEDVYREANLTSSDVSSVDVAEFIVDCEDILKLRTNRTAFTGSAANMARTAVVCMVIDKLITSRPEDMGAAIAEISENGATIKFNNGKTLESYKMNAEQIIQDLKISSPMSRYNHTNTTTFY